MESSDDAPLSAIEFETAGRSETESPGELDEATPKQPWAIAAVLVVIAAVLGVLFVLDSGSDGGVDEPSSQAVEEPGQVLGPEAFSASGVSISPEVLSVRLTEVEVFESQLIGLLNLTGVRVDGVPPLVSSADGQEWSEVPATASIEDETNTADFEWFELTTIGDDLGLSAFGPNTGIAAFGSSNGIDWDLFRSVQLADPLRPFNMVTGTDEDLIGFRFFDTGSVTCPGDTEPTEVSAHFRVVTIDRDTGEMLVVDEDGSNGVFSQSTNATELSPGRIAGISRDWFEGPERPCAMGDLPEPQGPGEAEFFIADVNTNSVDRWTIPVAFDERNEAVFLGEFVAGSLRRMLFAWNSELWAFHPDLGTWNLIWIPESKQGADRRSYLLSESHSRLYAIDNGELQIWDFVDSGGFLDVVDTSVELEPSETPPTDFSVARIMYADDDSVIFAADTVTTWRVELPVELGSCERQSEELVDEDLAIRCRMSQ